MSIRDQIDFGITFTTDLAEWVKEHRSLGKALPNGQFLFEMYVKRDDWHELQALARGKLLLFGRLCGRFTLKKAPELSEALSVENIGFEPITSSLPAKRSSQMS